MDFSLPREDEKLGKHRLDFLQAFKKSCTRTMLEMLRTSQSGHPGGSLSCLDFLSVLYAFRISRTGETVVISNGHISPGVYSILSELGIVDRAKLAREYRQFNSIFEGHVTRHVPGVWYGTGPLGIGVSVAAGFAWEAKKKNSHARVFATMGDGECQEGQVHEMALFAAKEKLSNLTVFVDLNRVQLSDSVEKICPIDVPAFFASHKWEIFEIDGHSPEAIWKALNAPHKSDRPRVIIGRTIMGKGIPEMEAEGAAFHSTWHGKAPSPEQIEKMLSAKELQMTEDELKILEAFRRDRKFSPPKPNFISDLMKMKVNTGTPMVYGANEVTDCRSAYGKALLDLTKNNSEILAATADLGESVKTDGVKKERSDQFLEFGITEQNMISTCGGISLSDRIPFCSTFGVFMTSRGRDQARVNDINHTNVKMVSTHCGLSVGEDGPTHQAIDDMTSMGGLLHTHVCEPADPNHCDRIIRFAASHYGNFYVRMGRAKMPTLTHEDGTVFFDKNYEYAYGRMDILRNGSDLTIVASGHMVHEALKARQKFAHPEKIEIVIASSNKKFDQSLEKSIRKTKRVIVVEDHNPLLGLGTSVALFATEKNIPLTFFRSLGVREYQLSGTPAQLYHAAGIDSDAILEAIGAGLK